MIFYSLAKRKFHIVMYSDYKLLDYEIIHYKNKMKTYASLN